MDRKDHKRFSVRLFCLILIAALLSASFSFADDLVDFKNDLTDVRGQLDNATKALKDGKAKSSQLSNEIKALEQKIYYAEVDINELEKEINATKEEIKVALAELADLQADIDNQNDALNGRLRAMYKNGSFGMLSVLLGSRSISEFLTNMELIRRVYQSDANVLKLIEDEYAGVAAKEAELQELKDKLLAQQEAAEAKRNALAADKNNVASMKADVDADNKELEKQIDQLNEEANALTKKILALQGSQAYAGGTMLWPAQSSRRITSPFGNRIHPILHVNKFHTGIDIGASSGTNILAANTGVVISAGWNNSYGYMVMVDHGGGIVTLYAHCSKLLVSKDDVVGRGDVIALVGSTGMSTGPHLHFEVRVNGVYKNPLEYVSP